MSTELTEHKKRLREEFIDARGYWNPVWEGLLDLDQDFFDAYTQFSSVPWRNGPLEPKVKEFVYIAVDAAATHLYVPGHPPAHQAGARPRRHGGGDHGGARADRTLGIHACNIGVPILVEELEAAGQPIDRELSGAAGGAQGRVHGRSAATGTRSGTRCSLLDADFFEAYTQFSSVPWVSGTLEPKVKELIYTAFDVVGHPPLPARACGCTSERDRLRRDARGDHGGDRARERDRHPLLHRRRADPARGARGRGDERDERRRRRPRGRAAAAVRPLQGARAGGAPPH